MSSSCRKNLHARRASIAPGRDIRTLPHPTPFFTLNSFPTEEKLCFCNMIVYYPGMPPLFRFAWYVMWCGWVDIVRRRVVWCFAGLALISCCLVLARTRAHALRSYDCCTVVVLMYFIMCVAASYVLLWVYTTYHVKWWVYNIRTLGRIYVLRGVLRMVGRLCCGASNSLVGVFCRLRFVLHYLLLPTPST